MPVYLPREVSFTPSSLKNFESFGSNDEDFVLDPEQVHDVLPQPFRMIDKILCDIVDNAWEIIRFREEERWREQEKVRPPSYECAVKVQDLEDACALAATPDGRFMLIGTKTGMQAMESSSQKFVCSWEEENMETVQIISCCLADKGFLVVAIDDMGQAQLFALYNDVFCHLKTLNEQSGSSKAIVSQCILSTGADYLAVVFECPSSQDCWLEVWKLPRDIWIKELDSAQTSKQQEEIKSDVAVDDPAATDPQKASEKQSHKFAAPTQLLKVKQPTCIQGCPGGSAAAHVIKLISGQVSDSDVIGCGTNHLLTQQHLDQRQEVFQHRHKNLLQYQADEHSKKTIQQPILHFINGGHILQACSEQASQTGSGVGICVWWAESSQVQFYNLFKQPPKELELKPCVVWPFSSPITCSALSDCSTLLAVGLLNGTVLLWDIYTGLRIGVIDVCNDGSIKQFYFIKPSAQQSSAPVPQMRSLYGSCAYTLLLVKASNSSLYHIDCSLRIFDRQAKLIRPCPDKDEENITLIEPLSGVQDVMLIVQRNGDVYLHDVVEKTVLCRIALPAGYALTTPWQPVLMVGANGQMLYVKGNDIASLSTVQDGKTSELFVFQLRSFPALDHYWNKEPCTLHAIIHCNIEQRIEALMKQRGEQQQQRTARLQTRWEKFGKEVELIKNTIPARTSALRKPHFVKAA